MIKLKLYIILLFIGFIAFPIFGQSETNKILATCKGIDFTIEQTLSEYIQFKSVSGNEKEAGEWLKALCLENGLNVTQMGETNGNYNFAASLFPLSQQLPNIIFLNHIDVVPIGDTLSWKQPPFSGNNINGEIWGRGAFDNKGSAVMQLFSILAFKNQNQHNQLPYNVTFLAVSSEETQTEGGVKYVVQHFLEQLNPDVVIGEGPPGLIGLFDENSKTPLFSISLAHKRALWIELELNIETFGHGSVTPNLYAVKEMNTALYKLLKHKQKAVYTDLNVAVLKQLGDLKGGFSGWVMKHPKLFKPLIINHLRKKPELFSIYSNTITLTGLESDNEAINVIPNKIKAYIDCRLLPETSKEQFLETLTKKLDNDAIDIKIIQEMPATPISSADSYFYNSISNALKTSYPESDVIKTLLPNFNDVGVFRGAGVQGFSFTPVILEKKYLESIHNVNERIPVSVLSKGQETYTLFLNELMKK